MAVVNFRQAEGSRTTTRTVQGISGGSLSGFIRINTALATPSPGDIVEIFTGALSGNASFLTLVNFSGGAGGLGLYVRPAPNQQLAAGGSIARLNRGAQRIPIAGVNISGVTALSGVAGNLAVVYAPGANFVASGVQRNDRAAISGSSISGNMGGWYVHEVLSEDAVVLRPPDRGPGMTTESPGTGTITVRQGFHTVLTVVSGSGEEIEWEATYAASGILPAQGSLSGYQGSGELRNYVKVIRGGSDTLARKHIRVQGLSKFVFNAPGMSGVRWQARNEVLSIPFVSGDGGAINANSSAHRFQMSISGTVPAAPIVINLGSPVFLEGNPVSGAIDQYSVVSGSSWCGASVLAINHGSLIPQWHGSYWDSADNVNYDVAPGTSGVASVVRAGSVNPPTGWISESLISYGAFGMVPTGSPDISNLLIPSNEASGSIIDAGSTIEGLILGGSVTQPWAVTLFNDPSTPARILNPRVDIDIFTYFSIFFGGGAVEKQYTFNPRFWSADGAVLISGLYVEIYEVSDIDGESLLLTDTSGSDGRLNGGAGYPLRVQRLDGATGYQNGTLTSYSYRVVTQGGGYRLLSRDYEFTEKFSQDVTIQHIAPDFEGEYDE